MWEKIHEKVESIFEVRQTKFTGRRIIMTFALIVLMAFSLPLYFMYEDNVHQAYEEEYQQVRAWTQIYYQQEGRFPLGDRVNLEEEKDLYAFFRENSLNPTRALYYVSDEDIPQLRETKYTYVIDSGHGALFTTEYVIFRMRRMHIPGY